MVEAGRVSALAGRESSQGLRGIALGRLMRYQAGVAALRQLRRLGFTEKEVGWMVSSGQLCSVSCGWSP